MLFDYDNKDINSIYNYAKKLEGMTFRDILNEFENSILKEYIEPNKRSEFLNENNKKEISIPNYNAKGQLGNLIEEYYFGYLPNGKQAADFEELGIELKQTCIDIKKNGQYTAGERLSITNISYRDEVEDDFFKSHAWFKMRQILLIHYIREKSKNRLDYQIKFVNLFTPPKDDLKIIIQDYHKIINKIRSGKAHELSESDTMYLGACTKGATAKTSIVPQYYGEHIPAKKRNFCFKRQYMDYVLNQYVIKNKVPYDSIMASNNLDENLTFEENIIYLINKNKGKTDKELCNQYNRPYNNNKAQWSELAYRMLGIRSNEAEEFVKANIKVKTIRIESNGKIVENMSLPPFKFMDLINETWEESSLYDYLETTKFLFVVYSKDGDCYKLAGAKLWNMPAFDLDTIVKDEWLEIQNTFINGVKFTIKNSIVKNNLPKSKDSKIIHVRPHASKSAYLLNNGYRIGDIEKDANILPDGQYMTNQSFWLKNEYILKQLDFLK